MSELNQYYTSKPISELLVSLLDLCKVTTCLELSAGEGALIDAVLSKNKNINFCTVDIDPENTEHLKIKFPRFEHICEDALNLKNKINKQFDLAVCNPPFGHTEFKSNLILLLDDNFSELFKNQKSIRTEVLFIFINLRLIKPGATLAIIVPDIIVNSHRLSNFREMLFSNYTLTNLVECGYNAFTKTEAKTYILYIKKETSSELEYNYNHHILSNGKLLCDNLSIKKLFSTVKLVKHNSFKIFRGRSSSKKCRESKEEFYHTSSKIDDNSFLDFHIEDKELNGFSYAIADDILVSRVGRDVGKTVFVSSGKVIVSDCIIIIRFFNNKDRVKFLSVWNKEKYKWLPLNVKGTCAKNISITNISNYIASILLK